MIRKVASYVTVLALTCFPLFVSAQDELNAKDKEVVALVDKAIKLMKTSGVQSALATINKKDGGFYDATKDLYVFIYNDKVEMLAHPYKPELVGKSYKGKPDVRGKMFRDEIVTTALSKGKGWTEYSYQKPGDPGIYAKVTFGKLVEIGGVKYIVCSGKYKDK